MMWKMPKSRVKNRQEDIENYIIEKETPWKSQLIKVMQRPEFLDKNFNPHNPNQKYNEENYMNILDNLSVEMDMKNVPIKLWT